MSDDGGREVSEKAKALAARGASKGGKARAAKMSRAARSAAASAAARARWDKVPGKIPRATHAGALHIGDEGQIVIPCAVLDDGARVLSQRAFLVGMGGTPGGNAKAGSGEGEGPVFLRAANLKPFVSDELAKRLKRPILYRPPGGGSIAHGIAAELIPQICEVWLKAREARALHYTQRRVAAQAELIMRGLAHVGIVALVDEATGYQADRARDELQRILAAYISPELLPWMKRFPDEYFKDVYRLHGWDYKPGVTKGPRYVGWFTKRYVYEKLPPGVIEELQRLNPAIDGRRKYRHFQFLTEHTGHPHLDRQIVQVMTLMRVSADRWEFKTLYSRAFPVKGQQERLLLRPRPN